MRFAILSVVLVGLSIQTGPAHAFWNEHYQSLHADARVPPFAHELKDEMSWLVQDDMVDLGQVTDNRAWRTAKPVVTYVYADVLRIPAGFVLLLDAQVLVVVARRIEFADDAYVYLDHSRDKNAALVVHAAEWDGALEVLASDHEHGEGASVHLLDGSGQLVHEVYHDGVEAVHQTGDAVSDEMYSESSPLAASLERALLVASLLPSERAEQRLQMLDWVLRMASRAPDLDADSTYGRLAADSAAQLAFFQAYARGSYVPPLDREVYRDVSAAYLTALERYETQYERFMDRAASSDQRGRAAELMLDHARAASQQKEAYLDQAHESAQRAAETVAQAERNFRLHEQETELARISFAVGLELWRHQQEVQAVFKGIEALLNFAAAAAGGMTFKLAAPGDLAAMFKSVGDIARSTAASMSGLAQAIQMSKTLAKGSANLTSALDGGRSDLLQEALHELDGLEGTLLFAGEEWTAFAIESRAVLRFAVDAGVGGATAYGAQLDLLALSAQTLLDARRNQARAQQELVQTLLALEHDQAFERRVGELVASLATDAEAERALEASFARRLVDLKRPLQLALLNYGAAYEYWALRAGVEPPSLLANAADFRVHLAALARDYERALSRFARPPQRLRSAKVVVQDPALLERFRETGELRLTVSEGEPAFFGLDRVRLSAVRVWFEGASCPGGRCLAQIRTSGHYEDRLEGRSFSFHGPALWRIFQYQTDPAGEPTVLVDGELADAFAFAYFEPTPFTEWTVSLDERANPGLDRSAVEAVTLEWTGSAIGAVH